jgi:hypothetical protein
MDYVEPGDSMVIIGDARASLVPWHVIAQQRAVSLSYLPSWASLLSILTGDSDSVGISGRRGLAAVPRLAEPATIVDSMMRLVGVQMARYSDALVAVGKDCDKAALQQMLEEVELATIVAHGYVSVTEDEVAFVVSENGSLPPMSTVVTGSAAGQKYRFGWRECAAIKRAPRLIVSSACGTGFVHYASSGEQLGIYNALSGKGLRSYIAPGWDVMANDALAFIECFLDIVADSGQSLCKSLDQAITETINDGTPEWCARAFFLTGDWR